MFRSRLPLSARAPCRPCGSLAPHRAPSKRSSRRASASPPFEKIRRADPAYWSSPRNEMGRGIYGEGLRERRRLHAVTDAQLHAETRGIESAAA